MKNRHVERLRLAAKLHHRTNRAGHFANGAAVRHRCAPEDARRPSQWEDVTFTINDYRVDLCWISPRRAYRNILEVEALRRVMHLYEDDPFKDATPMYKKVGRSRKKRVGWDVESTCSRDFADAYDRELAAMSDAENFVVTPYLKLSWGRYRRLVELCVPAEIRQEADIDALVALARRLVKRATTLADEFPMYRYEKSDWLRDQVRD